MTQRPEEFRRNGMTDEDVSAFVAATLGMKPQTNGFTFARSRQYISHYVRGVEHVNQIEGNENGSRTND